MTRQRGLIWTVVLGVALLVVGTGRAAVPAPPVNQTIGMLDVLITDRTEAKCRECHDSGLVDRHHSRYGTAMVSAGEAYPYPDPPNGRITAASDPDFDGDGLVDSTYACLSCHGSDFTVERDCIVCHTQSPHHTTANAVARQCWACHGSVVDDYDDDHYIPTYAVSAVTPALYADSGQGLPTNSRGTKAGTCHYCHDNDGLSPPVIQNFRESHHETWLDILGWEACMWCHDLGGTNQQKMRTCEQCHGPDTLHNTQADSPNAKNVGTVVIGAEDAGYGHSGRDAGPGDSDCWGCHGFAMGAGLPPAAGPAAATIYNTSGAVVKAGKDTLVELVGAAFTNMAGKTLFESHGVLTASDGSSVTLKPAEIDQGRLTVIIPAKTAPGVYKLRAVKTNDAGEPVASNPAVVTVLPQVVIDALGDEEGPITIAGSGFAGYAEGSGTSVTGTLGARTVEAEIISWTETRIRADFGEEKPQEVTVNSVFGSATRALEKKRDWGPR